MPVGSTFKENGKLSFIGASTAYKLRLNNHFSTGIKAGWNLFEDKHLKTATSDNITITQYVRTELRNLNILATGNYYFINTQSRVVLPSLSGGFGAFNEWRNSRSYNFDNTVNDWQFGIMAQAGLTILVKRVFFNLALSANHAFSTKNKQAESYIAMEFGIVIPN